MFRARHLSNRAPAQNHSDETGLLWQGAWGVSAQRQIPFFGKQAELNAQTVRQTLTTYASGDRLRLRISNAFGIQPLHIGAAAIALSEMGSTIISATSTSITFAGSESIIVPPGASILSDSVHFDTTPRDRLAISLFFPEKTLASTTYCGLTVENYLSTPGNHVNETDFPISQTINVHPFLIGIDVLTTARGPVIVALGDSITSGHDPDTSWPSALARRLLSSNGQPQGANVINAGIPGNMLRSDAENPNALARFHRDVLSIPGATHLILSIGINDIGRPCSAEPNGEIWQGKLYPARELIAAYRQLISLSHEYGLRIYGCTLTPFDGSFLHSTEKQKIHDDVNSWIRTSGEFDAIIDFASVVADPYNPQRLQEVFDMGDHLHLNEAGLGAIADAIDLSLFD